jgi:hypothetical protein
MLPACCPVHQAPTLAPFVACMLFFYFLLVFILFYFIYLFFGAEKR